MFINTKKLKLLTKKQPYDIIMLLGIIVGYGGLNMEKGGLLKVLAISNYQLNSIIKMRDGALSSYYCGRDAPFCI